MTLISDMKPGRIVEHDGDLYMIEHVMIEITMQKLESHAERIEEIYSGVEPDFPISPPMFTKVRGQLGQGTLHPDRFKLLFKEEEL